MDMKERLQELAENARMRIEESEGLDKLNDVRVAYLGKKGELTAILKGMKDVSPEERPKVGQLVNETRAKIEGLLEESKQKLEEALSGKSCVGIFRRQGEAAGEQIGNLYHTEQQIYDANHSQHRNR